MKPETVQGLEGTLTSLKEKTGAEIAVVTVKTLGNLDVSTYAVRLMKEWGIGSKELNDGVLLLVSTGERKVRIEVGYGLEGAITDARSGLILREHIIPYLKDNDYDSGLNNGALALAQLIAKEKGADMGGVARPQAPPEPVRRSGRTRGMPFGQIILIAIFILVFLGRGRGGNGCLTGLLLGSMLGGGRGGYGGFSGGGFSGGFGGAVEAASVASVGVSPAAEARRGVSEIGAVSAHHITASLSDIRELWSLSGSYTSSYHHQGGVMNSLPEHHRKKAESFAANLRECFGESLRSVVLYGPAARGEDTKGTVLSFMAVVTDNSPSAIAPCSGFMHRWTKAGIGTPLIVTPEYIADSLDTFPLEFMEMRSALTVVAGRMCSPGSIRSG